MAYVRSHPVQESDLKAFLQGIRGSISTALLSSGDVGQTINFPNLLIKLCLKVWKQPIQDGHVVDVLYGSRYTPEAKCNIIVKQEPHTPLWVCRES
jgi:hypothetical protein